MYNVQHLESDRLFVIEKKYIDRDIIKYQLIFIKKITASFIFSYLFA